MLPCALYKQRILRQETATKEIFRMCFEDLLAIQVELKIQLLSLLIPLLEGTTSLKKPRVIKFSATFYP